MGDSWYADGQGEQTSPGGGGVSDALDQILRVITHVN